MNEVLFSNEVIVYLLAEAILFLLLLVALAVSLKVLFKWDFEKFTPFQFALERQAYLVSTIILLVFGMKFLLIVYFIFSIDALSVLVPGAMCAAGVVTANAYGSYLLILKLIILAFLTLWLYIHFYDMHTKNHQWFKEKSWLFSFIFVLILFEFGLDFAYFSDINIHQPVSCCSALFGQLEGANPLPFGLSIPLLLVLFYLLFSLVILSMKTKQTLLYIVSNVLFIYIAYYAVVYFFGTYVYQLPTHKCPFCMFQVEYFYVGYLLWGSLFLGTYMGLSNAVTTLWINQSHAKSQKSVIVLLSLFVLVCTAYVAIYYFKNGVLL
ncbi:MAG: Possible membrane protein [uncultured Sulfurovum sp.]|uniref:Possible membrane protein n=1 Tax=uncultured Sulfurovum sp. TaxID=269237 RepID=A0A6S6U807_9BACT|nr:MAG: Possible membrane protein [uncultured Sulfurovum sp.]